MSNIIVGPLVCDYDVKISPKNSKLKRKTERGALQTEYRNVIDPLSVMSHINIWITLRPGGEAMDNVDILLVIFKNNCKSTKLMYLCSSMSLQFVLNNKLLNK